MASPVRAAALTAALAATAPAAASADVVLINVFTVPEGALEETLAFWDRAAEVMAAQPGYVSTALHQAISPEARHQLVNVAVWQDEAAFRAASARLRETTRPPSIEGLSFEPALYRVVRQD
ncbi:MAG: antibiotic biosynthesis monooxygenase family protein [Pseudomonadota bacterium]